MSVRSASPTEEHLMRYAAPPSGVGASTSTFACVQDHLAASTGWFVEGLARRMVELGHERHVRAVANTRLVLNAVDPDRPRPFRRRAQATFVATVAAGPGHACDVLATGYPILVRSLANLVILPSRVASELIAWFITPEQGRDSIRGDACDAQAFFDSVIRRIEPLASSHLVIDNTFEPDLERELWHGDERSAQLCAAGRRLAARGLLAPAYPLTSVLSAVDLRHVRRLFGIGGLSYGNLSVRKDGRRFWMSASGVDKGALETIGRDVLLVAGFDNETGAMVLSVRPDVRPRRVSVDAIEHHVIYSEHPGIGAIVHLHAWKDGIRSTETAYPCGTIELAHAVADLLREESDPSRAIIGLKNHGLTMTGTDMPDVMARLETCNLRHVPMP